MLGENGWLTRRLNYMKLRQKNIMAAELSVTDNSIVDVDEPPNPERDLEDLKTAMVQSLTRENLVQKLNSTRDLRKILLTKKETDLRHRFPFFFAEPKLVSVMISISLVRN